MKKKIFTVLGMILLLSAVVTFAEDSPVLKPASLKLSKGNGAWAIQIRRIGGIKDTYMDMTISSDGKVLCEPPAVRCTNSLNSEELKTWTDLVLKAPVPKSPDFIPDPCSDCHITAITIRRRNTKGKDQTLFASWGDASFGKPPELVEIVHAADSLTISGLK
jgi:hypothetical protein